MNVRNAPVRGVLVSDVGWEWVEDDEARQFTRDMRASGIMEDEFIAWAAEQDQRMRTDPNYNRMMSGETDGQE